MIFPDDNRPNGETPPPFFEEETPRRPVPPPPYREPQPQPPTSGESNPMGLAGFILSLVTLVGWMFPFAGFITWLLGLIFSCIGMSKRPRSFAIAGLIISVLVGLFFLMLFIFSFALISTMFAEPF